jgi:hypothetical protein
VWHTHKNHNSNCSLLTSAGMMSDAQATVLRLRAVQDSVRCSDMPWRPAVSELNLIISANCFSLLTSAGMMREMSKQLFSGCEPCRTVFGVQTCRDAQQCLSSANCFSYGVLCCRMQMSVGPTNCTSKRDLTSVDCSSPCGGGLEYFHRTPCES